MLNMRAVMPTWERLAGISPMLQIVHLSIDMRCSYCERETDVLVTYADGVSLCLTCRTAEQTRVEDAFRDVYGPDFAALATYQAEGR